MPKAPAQISYGDSFSVGQLAGHWGRHPIFVQRMINEGKLAVDERGLVTNHALRAFYAQHGTELDAQA